MRALAGRSARPGSPPADEASLTARSTACATTSAANAPTDETLPRTRPVERAKMASPSSIVCAGRMGTGKSVLRHLGDLGGAGLIQLDVRGDHADGGVRTAAQFQEPYVLPESS